MRGVMRNVLNRKPLTVAKGDAVRTNTRVFQRSNFGPVPQQRRIFETVEAHNNPPFGPNVRAPREVALQATVFNVVWGD